MARILVPFDGSAASAYVLDVACGLAGDSGDEVQAIYVIRIPAQLPISAEMPDEHASAVQALTHAHAIADRYQAPLLAVVVSARAVGPAIVEIARDCDCVMIGQSARRRFVERLLPHRTLRYVLAHAACQVLISYAPPAPDATAAPAHQFMLSPGAHTERIPGNVIPLQERPLRTYEDTSSLTARKHVIIRRHIESI